MDTQVIVVGAGPVGLMLAGELRLGGAAVIVLERLVSPMTESRASTLHARTMEILDARGLAVRLGSPPRDPMGHFGGIPLDLGYLPSRYAGQWKVPQTRVEQLLAEWAGELGAQVWRGHEVVDVATTDDGVRVSVTGPAGPVTLTGRYLVGCDGEESTVRRAAGIGFPGTDATCEMLRADVAGIEIPDRRFQRLPKGLAIAARRPDGVTRVMVAESGRCPAKRTDQPSFGEVCELWSRVTGEDISHGRPLWGNAFGNTCRQAERYRNGRILLAGDAAHQQMPVGGQAINLGLQDAVNLGWKLAAVVSGRVPDTLLDTYHEERHGLGTRVLGAIQAQALLLLGGIEVEPVRAVLAELMTYPVVRDGLAGVISGLDARYGDGDGHWLVGRRLPHASLRLHAASNAVTDPADGGTSTTELLRAGRGVLFDLSADPVRRSWLSDALAPWAGRLDVVSATPLARGQLDGFDTLLARPDGYTAWVGGRDADPRADVHRWFGPANA